MKKPRIKEKEIELVVQEKQPRVFRLPEEKVKGLLQLISDFEVKNEETVPADVVFKELDEKYSKGGNVLYGLRLRENMTQVLLAKKLGVPQAHISAMENGKRPIGKNIAKRLAAIFKVDYRVFL